MTTNDNIRYIFRFKNGETKEFLLRFDSTTLDLIPDNKSVPPSWAALSVYKCNNCPLDPDIHEYCPTALHLGWILNELQEYDSFEEVTIEVVDFMRSYVKETSLQDGLGSLMGIIMPTGGCPLLKPLRPMVRFHLPFASLEEMEYRMVSMYLFAQYLRQQNGEEPDWTLDGLQDIYKKVSDVNKSFAYRVSTSSKGDVGINAIIILDCFAKTVPKAIQNMMKDFETIFAPHLQFAQSDSTK
ncbi:MAG: hypothetical protein PHN84_03120 [Desulfuromonadaceae bacterium]|nr:hypothetical protein [Desulfuromonadaceae bacterium]MDD2856014.1 hypothetical protein [Desulfuromonadaceae bacterium]